MEMKIIVGRYDLLLYPNFSEEFITNMDARKTQIRGVMSQNGNPTTFTNAI